jgi:hypothetical protein
MTRATLLRTYAGRLRGIANMLDHAADLCIGQASQAQYEYSFFLEEVARKEAARAFDQRQVALESYDGPRDAFGRPDTKPHDQQYERIGD